MVIERTPLRFVLVLPLIVGERDSQPAVNRSLFVVHVPRMA